MKRVIIYLTLLMLFGMHAQGQSFYRHPEIFYYPSPGPEKYYADKLDNEVSDNPGLQYRMHTGMMFISLYGFNSITSYVSPKLLIPVGTRSVFEVGTTFLSTSFPGDGSIDRRINSLVAYARGIYSVNEQMTVWGEVMKSINTGVFNESPNFESITMGMEYSITPNFRIGASITSQKGIDPFYPVAPYPGSYRYGPAWY